MTTAHVHFVTDALDPSQVKAVETRVGDFIDKYWNVGNRNSFILPSGRIRFSISVELPLYDLKSEVSRDILYVVRLMAAEYAPTSDALVEAL